MKNIQNIVIAILSLCVIVLFYLTLNKNTSGPQVLLNPSSKTLSNVDFGRVAFINTDTFFERYTKFKNIEKELEAQQKQAQAGLEGQMKQLEKEYMQLMQQAQADQINQQQGQQKEQALVKRKQALEAESQKSMKGLAEKTQKANTDIRKVLKEYIEKNKERYGCNYVLGYQTEGAIFYVDPKFDITQQVLEDLNK
jgi:Skp family chaperone for outer membrane proteins